MPISKVRTAWVPGPVLAALALAAWTACGHGNGGGGPLGDQILTRHGTEFNAESGTLLNSDPDAADSDRPSAES